MKFQAKNFLVLLFSVFASGLFAREITGVAASQQIKGAEKIITGTQSDFPEYIQFRKEAAIPVGGFSIWAHQVLGVPSNTDFKLISTEKDQIGMTHYRYQQTVQGIPVEGTMFIVHVKDNSIVSVNGTLFRLPLVSTVPSLDEATALGQALSYVHATQYRWQVPGMEALLKKQSNDPAATWFPKGELMLAPAKGKFEAGSYRLAYRFDVYAQAPLSRNYIFVDASTGEVVYTKNRIQEVDKIATAVTGYSGTREMTTDSVNTTTYRLREAGRGNGIQTYNLQQTTNYTNTDFLDADNYWNNVNAQLDQYAADAHWGAEKTYDFYWTKFGRNSIDGNGMLMLSYVHYDVNYVNAFWDGTEMTYGDGDGTYTPLTSLDVTGHEISHGVTERTSNLVYQDEPGAMNESFSDCMGNAIRYYGKQPASVDWLIGDEIGGTPFRSMSDPNAYGDPDTYQGVNWKAPGSGDNGGVHSNSGVMNHWFYLLSEGGTGTNDNGDAYTVVGLGINTAAAICFRMNTVYLVTNSQYADARTYALQAAIDLYGPCTNEVIQTANAWHAVGVGNAFTPGVTSDFIAPVTVFCSAPATVDFSNQSSNGGTYTWDFGDGSSSNAINPSHTYTSFGTYNVSLIADGGSCGIDTVVKTAFIDINSSNPCIVSLPTNGTASTQSSCAGQLYDSGGPTGDYTDNTDATITIAPTGASTVTLTFSSFSFESNYDYLYIYDGPNTGSPVIGSFTGNALPNGGTITSTGSTITLRQSTDQGVTASGFGLTWQCTLSSTAPTANFAANTTTSCSGTIQFSDHSVNGPTSWAWDFGDGGTSASQNPSHTYTSNGTYTVELIVSNAFGSDTLTQTNYITVNLPGAPTGTGASFCPGTSATLSATGTGVIAWYTVATGGTAVGTGSSFTTPVLSATTTYYAEDDVYPASQFNNPVDNSFGTGGYFTNTNYHDLIFDCYAPVILKSVKVYAQGAGQRTITLIANGSTLASTTVNIPDGESRVTLNFPVPVGTNLELGCQGFTNLYRNQGGATFPFTLPGLISITGTNAGTAGYYYFFYDWEMQEYPCLSARVPVVATAQTAPTAAYSTTITANVVDFTNLSTNGTSYNWDFGDGSTSTSLNTTHTYSALGTYTVCLTVTGANGCIDTTCQSISIISLGLQDLSTSGQISVYPNPVNDQLTVKFSATSSGQSWLLKLTDMAGQVVAEKKISNVLAGEYNWNVSSLSAGVYFMILESGNQKFIQKVIHK